MLLEKLCNSSAPSGYEGDTRNLIKDELKKMDIDFCIDKMGNVLAKKENNQTLKIMIAAHMDEVGLIITSYLSLYTSDAADEEDSVHLRGRRITEKKKSSRLRSLTST